MKDIYDYTEGGRYTVNEVFGSLAKRIKIVDYYLDKFTQEYYVDVDFIKSQGLGLPEEVVYSIRRGQVYIDNTRTKDKFYFITPWGFYYFTSKDRDKIEIIRKKFSA
jgi:hypothetical protein